MHVQIAAMTSKLQVNTVWALAKLAHQDHDFLAAFVKAAAKKLGEYIPQVRRQWRHILMPI